ncbi:MAG: DUF5693 family protein [Synergistaceae bacterium]|jgi:hypothetical protein|nr:DUF5693 family protein [Synergistaceae bacterium]
MSQEWENEGDNVFDIPPQTEFERPRPSRTERRLGLHLRKKSSHRGGNAFLDVEKFFWAMLLLAVLFSSYDLYRRLKVEWSHRTVAIAVEYRDLVLLSRQAGEGIDVIYSRMRNRGAEGVTVAELTGKELASGFLPISYGSLATFRPVLRFALSLPLDRAAVLIDNSEPLLQPIVDYMRIRMKDIVTLTTAEGTLVVLPATMDELADSGILPDFPALAFAERVGAVSMYRPQPAPGVNGTQTAESIRWLKGKYPSISCVIPAGQIIAGYPELGPFERALKELGIPVAQPEFVRQIGVSELYSGMNPEILPLHSLVKEELISRRLTRAQIIERMVRAVHERSIRIILFRPYELYSVGKLDPFLEDMQIIRDGLNSRYYYAGWPETMPMIDATAGAAIGVAIIFAVMIWSYARRFFGEYGDSVTNIELAIIFFGAATLGLCAWIAPPVSKMMGGLATAFLATEATIWALDRYDKPFYGLLAGLLIVFAGGLCIASFYGTTTAMLRLAPFSGVKLTLLLPPVLILANDLKQRIHPESMLEVISRPPLWGELMLVGVLIVGAVVITVRSDNANFVPGWEIRFRDLLEWIMWVRPRTKEFLVGYPCLIIYYVMEKRGWGEHYREVFRLGACMAFASAVNSFCHFHTLLPLTIVRVANGWCLGIVVGFVALVLIDYVGGPILRGAAELFD